VEASEDVGVEDGGCEDGEEVFVVWCSGMEANSGGSELAIESRIEDDSLS
jgi:hypothetical protein